MQKIKGIYIFYLSIRKERCNMQKISYFFLSLLSGLLNGLFASGGGIPAVAALKNKGLSQKSAQATALCVTLILSVASLIYYCSNNYFNLSKALIYIPFGIPGAFVGSMLLKRLPDRLLRKLFALFILWAGARMLF